MQEQAPQHPTDHHYSPVPGEYDDDDEVSEKFRVLSFERAIGRTVETDILCLPPSGGQPAKGLATELSRTLVIYQAPGLVVAGLSIK